MRHLFSSSLLPTHLTVLGMLVVLGMLAYAEVGGPLVVGGGLLIAAGLYAYRILRPAQGPSSPVGHP